MHTCAQSDTTRTSIVTIRKFSSIPKKPLQWLWQNRIPRGKITLLAGDPGTGKTSLLLDLAARLSRAETLPSQSPAATAAAVQSAPEQNKPPLPAETLTPKISPLTPNPYPLTPEPAATLLLSPDDDPEDTLRPKLELLNANLDQIHTLENFHSLIPTRSPTRSLSPSVPQCLSASPLEKLEAAIQAIPNLALLIIDPITHFLGLSDRLLPLNPDDPDSPRSILFQLSRLAQKYNLAIVLTTRLNKKINPTLSPTSIQRILGPLAFPSTARSVMLLTPLPSVPECLSTSVPSPTHLLLPLKLNGAPLPNPIPFTLSETITWHPEIPAESLHPTTPHKTPGPADFAAQLAATWLRDALADGPVAAYSIIRQAKDNAISSSTLERAKQIVGIQSIKQDWSGKWFWQLPNDSRPLPENAIDKQMTLLLNRMNGRKSPLDQLSDAILGPDTSSKGGDEPDDLADFLHFSDKEPEDLRENRPPRRKQPEHLRKKPQKNTPQTPPPPRGEHNAPS